MDEYICHAERDKILLQVSHHSKHPANNSLLIREIYCSSHYILPKIKLIFGVLPFHVFNYVLILKLHCGSGHS